MRKLRSVFVCAMATLLFFAFAVARPAFGTTRYIAQSAGTFSGGTACNGQSAITSSTFNGATNAPGDVNYICGTITGSAGSQLLTPKGNGAAGNPVTIIFDAGAILQAPYFAGSPNGGCGGAICLYGLSYYTVDGQNTGIIQNTANGTSLAYKQATEAVEGYNCNNCTVKNLTIANMYVHTSNSDDTEDQTGIRCISFNGSNWLIQNNVMHDVGWCLFNNYNNGDTNVDISGNTMYRLDHAWMLATQHSGGNSGPFLFHGNNIYNYSNWDTTSNSYHHDGIHCYTSGTNGSPAHISTMAIYNNSFAGPIGVNVTGHIFMEAGSGSGSTPCSDASSVIQLFNNVFSADAPAPNGLVALFSAGTYSVYNNTIITSDSPSDSNSVGFSTIEPNSGNSVVFKNNAISGFNQELNIGSGMTYTTDYNQYGNGGSNAFVCKGSYYDSTQFSSWKSCIGGDSNSAYSASLNLSSSGVPQSGSAVIAKGVNLTSLCTGTMSSLCSDKAGNARPSTGSWTVGAYSISGGGPQPPTGLTGTVIAK
jgi:hypothetical protein